MTKEPATTAGREMEGMFSAEPGTPAVAEEAPAVDPGVESDSAPETPEPKAETPEPAPENPAEPAPEAARGSQTIESMQAELDRLKGQMSDYELKSQLVDIVNSDPRLNEAMRRKVAGLDAFPEAPPGTTPNTPAPAPAPSGTSIPEPQKPEGYNEVDAGIPGTSSHTWHLQHAQWKTLAALEARVAEAEKNAGTAADQKINALLAKQAQDAARQEMNMVLTQAGHGDKIADFWTWTQGLPRSSNGELLKMFLASKGLAEGAKPETKSELAKQRKNAEQAAASAAAVPGAPPSTEKKETFFPGFGGSAIERLRS